MDPELKECLEKIDRRLEGVERGVRAGKRSMRGLELAMITVMNKLGGAIHDTRSHLGLGPWQSTGEESDDEVTPHDSPSEKMKLEFEQFSMKFPDDEGAYKVKVSENPEGSRLSVEGDDPTKVREIVEAARKRNPVVESLRPVGRALRSRTGKVVTLAVGLLSALAGAVQWLEAHGFLK